MIGLSFDDPAGPPQSPFAVRAVKLDDLEALLNSAHESGYSPSTYKFKTHVYGYEDTIGGYVVVVFVRNGRPAGKSR